MSAPLKIEGLSAGYGELPVLREISLEVRAGEIVALVGSNGAGKTTLLRALSRVIGFRGRASFAGRELGEMQSDEVFALGLVQVPEGRQLFDRMSVEENLLMGAYRRSDRAGIKESLAEVYHFFPILYERRHQLSGSLSGGEQQMCAMARGLMASPKLFALDEMSLGLAPVLVDQLLDTLARIRKLGTTVLLVEQDVFAALSIADRCYILETGSIVREGSATELAGDPQIQRAYLGL
jgi:branched-chain amino acid transport system ATP-binding protein